MILNSHVGSVPDDDVSRYELWSSMIKAVPSDLDSSDRTAFLVRASYHAWMHREERGPSHRGVSRRSHHEL